MTRVLLIGWDGADWRILDPLMESGVLPNLAALVSRGGRATLRSTLPTHSWTAWPSFLTGVDPADHGVYDIFESRGRGAHRLPVSFGSIRERTFLADLTDAGVETVMMNVPITFPPPVIKGKLVAGGVLPKRRPYTYPEGLASELESAGVPFPINGMSWTTFHNRPEPFLAEALALTRARQRATEHVLDTTDWQVACLVFVATDRINHCLAPYVSPDHPRYGSLSKEPVAERVRDAYRLLDEGLGRLVSRAGPDDLVLFMSDHGSQSTIGNMNMDRLLEHFGFLEFSASAALFGRLQAGRLRGVARKVYDRLGLHGKVALPQSVNWSKTRAYTSVRSTGEGISVNVRGREPEGIVDPGDFERIRDEVAERVASFVDPQTGRRPVGRIWRREEIFKGRFADEAPDLLLEPSPLYSLTHAREMIEPAGWACGDHRPEGVLAAVGPHVDAARFPDTAKLIDLAPTILAAVGAPASVRHSGAVLSAVVGERAAAAAMEAGRSTALARDPEEAGLDPREAEEVEEHLRGLGYLE
ncbi:MAG TPA: alkaline phosphatase family protein [Actinomycetota bacterium]|nr:alkaline phosphatase family protein [Actinomycetota bacterium]